MNYCIVENLTILNIIVCDDPVYAWEQGFLPSYDDAGIGEEYDAKKAPVSIIKIEPRDNGAHDNQRSIVIEIPEGWAVIPYSLGTPDTLEHYPFGDITVEDRDGVPTVTSWTPLPIPETEEPEPGPGPGASLEQRVDALETETAAISAAIERGLNL